MSKNSNFFGIVRWTNEDIALAFESADFDCTDEDIAAIRKACNARIYGIRDAMTEAGWNFIHNDVADRIREREAIYLRAREEEHYDHRQ